MGPLLVSHSFRRRFLIGTCGRCLCCDVFFCDPIESGWHFLRLCHVGLLCWLTMHSYRRRFLIGTWGRCLWCGVTFWDPIISSEIFVD